MYALLYAHDLDVYARILTYIYPRINSKTYSNRF